MSATSDNTIVDKIDFGGRFARQFSDTTNWSQFSHDPSCLQLVLNPTSSTPAASDNSICDSAYDSFQVPTSCSSANQVPTSCSAVNQVANLTARLSINSNTNSNNNNNIGNNNIAERFRSHSHSAGVLRNSLPTTPPTSKLISCTTTSHSPNPWSTRDLCQRFSNIDAIERAASLHRSAATYSEPHYTWSGQLPSRSYKNPVYSCKVFLGGVPWDVTEAGLTETFGRFGPLRVQWPVNKDRQSNNSNNNDHQHHNNSGPNGGSGNNGGSSHTKAGYVYLIYESERYVKALLKACTQDFGSGSHPEKYYYQLSSRRMRFKEVQVIPWVLADSNYIRNQSGRPDIHRTVFVGALHGMLTAEGLAKIMNDLFGGVAYVGIDSDKHKYPIGSGRVTFNNHKSYLKAVSAAFVEVKSSQFCKKIQLDPYMESSECSTCHVQNGPIFCRDCLRYFCKTCWNWHHSSETIHGRQGLHHPLMRKKREA